ncbi:TPR domain-containing protein [Daldinia caldariorum]|uniref:TPR domain-containing protein n=1 Tax=Daldinia caldariorum TaxID=326644 RepID=UPI002008EA83|nr:TPR domain-containing protein [Daldinia caldariorum]KAI1466019.1 TPR domain-containing protein [Daldinia caldariorum]
MLSASRTPIIAPARRCFFHARSSHQKRIVESTSLGIQLQRAGICPSEAALIRSFQQRRHQSSSPNKPNSQPPPVPDAKLLLRALRQSLSLRPLVSALRGQSLGSLYRQSPEELVIAIILLCGVAGISVYVIYAYFNYFQSKQFTRFPPPIAKSLRRALYYSNYSPDPPLALKYYKRALEQCSQLGLDPFSDEVMGIKIQLAAWLEKIGSYKNSIDVLESLVRDCKRWLEVLDKSVQDGLVDSSGKLVGSASPPPPAAQETAQEDTEKKEPDTKPENLWGKRTRILGKLVGISVKLGELYSDEHVLQGDSAGQHLVWAVETVLKELQRRQSEGVKEGEGDWMTPEQIGGALEALGNHYESKSQHYLAAPLFLQAVSLSPQNSCHTAVLMNNLAISLAQQPVQTPTETDQTTQGSASNVTTRPTRSTLLASARAWALKAQEMAQKVQGEDRTEECDEACAVALCNLGDIAAMAGDAEEARRRFEESLSLSKRIAFDPGVAQAQDGLRRLS